MRQGWPVNLNSIGDHADAICGQAEGDELIGHMTADRNHPRGATEVFGLPEPVFEPGPPTCWQAERSEVVAGDQLRNLREAEQSLEKRGINHLQIFNADLFAT